jgi:hypothetical protein
MAVIPHSPDEPGDFERIAPDSGIKFSTLWWIEQGGDGGPDG